MTVQTDDRLVFHADLLSVRELGPWLAEVVPGHCDPDLASGLIPKIELSIHEVCVNIVEHAYADTDGVIEVQVRREGDDLRFDLRDSGRGFDPSLVNVPDPAHPTIRGYGLMIVGQLSSRLHYERVDDSNRWTVCFAAPSTNQINSAAQTGEAGRRNPIDLRHDSDVTRN